MDDYINCSFNLGGLSPLLLVSFPRKEVLGFITEMIKYEPAIIPAIHVTPKSPLYFHDSLARGNAVGNMKYACLEGPDLSSYLDFL